MMAASSSTEPSTWPRVAPMARSRASSRVRWATRMLKVFEMMNQPTNRAMTAKTSRIVVKKAKPSLTSLACSSEACSPVTTSTLGRGSASCDALRRAARG